jgi:hypothetical protein
MFLAGMGSSRTSFSRHKKDKFFLLDDLVPLGGSLEKKVFALPLLAALFGRARGSRRR